MRHIGGHNKSQHSISRRTPRARRAVRTVILALAVFLAVSFFPAGHPAVSAAEKKPSTYVENATAHVSVNKDGTVDITETIRFHFGKPYKSLTFNLLFPLDGESQLQSFEIAQDPDHEKEVKYIEVPLLNNKYPQPFSYTTERLKDKLRLHLSMTSFTDDYIFRLSYQWTRGVVEKDGRALISGPLCVVPNNMRVETLLWMFTFPEDCLIDTAEIVPVAYHMLTENKTSSNSVSFIDNQHFVKTSGTAIAISMPKRCFPFILPASDTTPLARLLSGAQSLSARLSKLESLRESITHIVTILSAVGLIIVLSLQFFSLTGKRRVRSDFALWPLLSRPAETVSLASLRLNEPDLLLATLLSLVTRREISWTDEVFIWNHPNRNDFSQFTTYETLLLQWLFIAQPEYDNVLSPERLRIAARGDDFRQLAQRFRKHVDTAFANSGLSEPLWTKVIRLACFCFSILFFALSIFFYIYTNSPLTFIMLINTALFALSGLSFRFLTAEGRRHAHEIRRFARALKSPGLLTQSTGDKMTEIETLIGALPAAIALGRTSEYLSGVKKMDSPYFDRAAYALLHVYRGLKMPAAVKTDIDPNDPYERILLRRALDEMERILAAWRELFNSCFL